MAELDLRTPPIGQGARAVLRRARTELAVLDAEGASATRRRAVVVAVADRLAALARRPGCPPAVADVLHDWRDRLGSHVLVAEALAELEVHPDLADQLLRRAVDELLDEAPERLAGVSADRAAVPHA